MATTCDYCHKPLSLMRRLRGEQFCSVEHLDQYSAQQAEFALERLAASVPDKPNTERPPTLKKSAPKLRPITAPPANPTSAPAAQPALQSAVAVQEQEIHAVEETSPVARISEADYPMAPYLGQADIEPRELETVESRRAELAPVDTWGKVSPSWSMPTFHSEPSDPRTWNAGKLTARIPPVAGWRELLDVKSPEPLEFTNDLDAELPHLDVELTRIQGTATGADLRNVFFTHLSQRRSLVLQPGAFEASIQAEQPVGFAVPLPVFTHMKEAIRNGFRLASNRMDFAALIHAELQARSLAFTWTDVTGPQFAPFTPAQGVLILTGSGTPVLLFATTQRQGLTPVANILSSETAVGPAAPEAPCTLPRPTGWEWTQSFVVPTVAMPELLPKNLLHPEAIVGTVVDWQEVPGTVEGPAVKWAAPRFGSIGPSFGWETSQPKPVAEVASTAMEQARYDENIQALGLAPAIKDFRAKVSVSLESPTLRVREGWSTPRTDAVKFEVGPLVTLRPTVTALDVQVRPLMPFPPARLESSSEAASQLAPQPGHRPVVPAMGASVRITTRLKALPTPAPEFDPCGMAAPVEPAMSEMQGKIAQLGPLKYSPVTILVVPPPQFALLPSTLTDEQRYVAQSPNGVWRLPRVRHTGYRALGPFPKLPLRMPDRYLHAAAPVMHPSFQDVPRTRIEKREDLAGMPAFETPVATRIHPADYWAWPQPKGVKSLGILPEREYQQATGSSPVRPAPVRRFGPGRAGLQVRTGSADGQAKGRGLR